MKMFCCFRGVSSVSAEPSVSSLPLCLQQESRGASQADGPPPPKAVSVLQESAVAQSSLHSSKLGDAELSSECVKGRLPQERSEAPSPAPPNNVWTNLVHEVQASTPQQSGATVNAPRRCESEVDGVELRLPEGLSPIALQDLVSQLATLSDPVALVLVERTTKRVVRTQRVSPHLLLDINLEALFAGGLVPPPVPQLPSHAPVLLSLPPPLVPPLVPSGGSQLSSGVQGLAPKAGLKVGPGGGGGQQQQPADYSDPLQRYLHQQQQQQPQQQQQQERYLKQPPQQQQQQRPEEVPGRAGSNGEGSGAGAGGTGGTVVGGSGGGGGLPLESASVGAFASTTSSCRWWSPQWALHKLQTVYCGAEVLRLSVHHSNPALASLLGCSASGEYEGLLGELLAGEAMLRAVLYECCLCMLEGVTSPASQVMVNHPLRGCPSRVVLPITVQPVVVWRPNNTATTNGANNNINSGNGRKLNNPNSNMGGNTSNVRQPSPLAAPPTTALAATTTPFVTAAALAAATAAPNSSSAPPPPTTGPERPLSTAAAAAPGAGAAAAGVQADAVPAMALVIRYNLSNGLRSSLQQLHRVYAMLSNLSGIVTLFTLRGRVLHQNTASIRYMGLRQGCGGQLDDPRVSTDTDNPRDSTGLSVGSLLGQIFALSTEQLEDMLEDVVEGKTWKGIVRVPALLTPTTDPGPTRGVCGGTVGGVGSVTAEMLQALVAGGATVGTTVAMTPTGSGAQLLNTWERLGPALTGAQDGSEGEALSGLGHIASTLLVTNPDDNMTAINTASSNVITTTIPGATTTAPGNRSNNGNGNRQDSQHQKIGAAAAAAATGMSGVSSVETSAGSAASAGAMVAAGAAGSGGGGVAGRSRGTLVAGGMMAGEGCSGFADSGGILLQMALASNSGTAANSRLRQCSTRSGAEWAAAAAAPGLLMDGSTGATHAEGSMPTCIIATGDTVASRPDVGTAAFASAPCSRPPNPSTHGDASATAVSSSASATVPATQEANPATTATTTAPRTQPAATPQAPHHLAQSAPVVPSGNKNNSSNNGNNSHTVNGNHNGNNLGYTRSAMPLRIGLGGGALSSNLGGCRALMENGGSGGNSANTSGGGGGGGGLLADLGDLTLARLLEGTGAGPSGADARQHRTGLTDAVRASIVRRRSALKLTAGTADDNPLSTSTWGLLEGATRGRVESKSFSVRNTARMLSQASLKRTGTGTLGGPRSSAGAHSPCVLERSATSATLDACGGGNNGLALLPGSPNTCGATNSSPNVQKKRPPSRLMSFLANKNIAGTGGGGGNGGGIAGGGGGGGGGGGTLAATGSSKSMSNGHHDWSASATDALVPTDTGTVPASSIKAASTTDLELVPSSSSRSAFPGVGNGSGYTPPRSAAPSGTGLLSSASSSMLPPSLSPSVAPAAAAMRSSPTAAASATGPAPRRPPGRRVLRPAIEDVAEESGAENGGSRGPTCGQLPLPAAMLPHLLALRNSSRGGLAAALGSNQGLGSGSDAPPSYGGSFAGFGGAGGSFGGFGAASASVGCGSVAGIGGGSVAGVGGGGGTSLLEAAEDEEDCWHEVTASCLRDPVSGEQTLMLMQVDVSARVRAERKIAEVLEAEHKLLESVFPRHVLELAAAGQQTKGARGGRGGLAASKFSLAELPLAQNCASVATYHPMVTILFSDIIGFTSMCHEIPATKVMEFLNNLYSRLDTLLDVYGVYKVETIGDCYMVAGGLMARDADGFMTVRGQDSMDELHAAKVMSFAKAMLRETAEVLLPTTGAPVQMRIGLHSGPVMSGIVGSKMPRFCLFGDTVNTASRMESTCPPGCIHVSAATREILQDESWEPTGGVQVKGKGLMETFRWIPPDMDGAGGCGGRNRARRLSSGAYIGTSHPTRDACDPQLPSHHHHHHHHLGQQQGHAAGVKRGGHAQLGGASADAATGANSGGNGAAGGEPREAGAEAGGEGGAAGETVQFGTGRPAGRSGVRAASAVVSFATAVVPGSGGEGADGGGRGPTAAEAAAAGSAAAAGLAPGFGRGSAGFAAGPGAGAPMRRRPHRSCSTTVLAYKAHGKVS
ncbi:hypothetical protein Agub_g2807 [Astrephomene gubernaculifera]|uniref:Guanylate cyclase domain-containing protein n=1 Tax=Astrephomene gubernaculifera TaxID=47775 RepID=A0AAD3DIT4_9CHLO|nr:hypothetical protein Agub_g2807 [Astrephomene gubernaculifera]